MSKYFKIIGILELIALAFTLVLVIIAVVQSLIPPSVVDAKTKFILILELVLLILCGPSLGFLFIYVGKLIDKIDNLEVEVGKAEGKMRIMLLSSKAKSESTPTRINRNSKPTQIDTKSKKAIYFKDNSKEEE